MSNINLSAKTLYNRTITGNVNSMIKAIIFDMDGVVAKTIPAHLQAWQIIFWQKFRIRLTKQYFFKYLNARQGPITISIVTGKNIPFAERVRITQKKDRLSKKLLQNIKPTLGLINFLKFLKKNKIKIGMATSAQPEMMKFLMRELKIKKYFDYIVTAKEIKHSKPHPECYLKTAKHLKVKPQEAIIIEDAPLGIQAAKAGKFLKAIAITNSQPAKDFKTADLIIKNFSDPRLSKIFK